MPNNKGKAPRVARCDIRFRNGDVERNTEPRLWRWSLDDPAFPIDCEWDIVSWQKPEVGR